MVSSIFDICLCFLYFTELMWFQKKLKKTLYTAVSMHIIEIHKVLRRFFRGVKCPGYRDLNKCQIPAHPWLDSCQMPGVARGGGWALLDLTHTLYVLHSLTDIWCRLTRSKSCMLHSAQNGAKNNLTGPLVLLGTKMAEKQSACACQ